MNSTSPLFSIVTVNLNNKEGLRNTIEHLIDQTYSNYEFIIIDGGSTDGSREIMEKYRDNISFLVSEKDRGIYHAMNKGIQHTRGKYCLFLNSGDYLVNENVLETVESKNSEADILFGNLVVVSAGKIIDRIKGKNYLTFIDIYNNRVKHQASFIKRSLFDKYGLYNEKLKIISDWEFFIRSIGIGDATYDYLNMDISYYDNNGISNVNNMNNSSREESQIVIERHIPSMMQPDYEFLKSIYRYRGLFNNKYSLFLIRALTWIMNKCGKGDL